MQLQNLKLRAPSSVTLRVLFWASLLSLSFLTGFLVYHATPLGPSAFSDTVEYLEAGRNFAAGQGFTLQRTENRWVPLSLRPPFFPLVLGLQVKAGIDPVEGSRWLNILLFSSLILMTGGAAYAFTRNSGIALLLTLYLVTQHDLLDIFASMMSEPLFITFTMLQIALLVVFAYSGKRWILSLATLLTAMLILTRFAGLANLALLGVGVLLFHPRSFRYRLIDASVSILAAALPFGAWSLAVRSSGYSPGVYNFRIENIWSELTPVRGAFVDFIWSWLPFRLLPFEPTYRERLLGLGLLFLGVFIWTVLSLRSSGKSFESSFRLRRAFSGGFLLILYSFMHLAVIAASYAWVESPKPALYSRVLMPSCITLITGLGILFYDLSLASFRRYSCLLTAAFITSLVVANTPQMIERVTELHADGRGYTASFWHELPILEALKRLPPEVPVVSNDPDAIMFFTNRPAYPLPEIATGQPIEISARFGERTLDKAEVAFRERGAALVLLPNHHSQLMQVYGEQVNVALRAMQAGLFISYQGEDGKILYYTAPAP